MNTKDGTILFDNTSTIIRNRAETNDSFYFLDRNIPVFPAPSASKPKAVDGAIAYSINGGKGIAEYIDGKLSVNDHWKRENEWSTEKWTDEDRKSFYDDHKKISEEREEYTGLVLSALNERKKLRREFSR